MLSKLGFLSLLACLPVFAQGITPPRTADPIPTKDQQVCKKIVSDLSQKLHIYDESYYVCTPQGSQEVVKAKKDLPDCISKILSLTSERYDLVNRCISKNLYEEFKNKHYVSCLTILKSRGFSRENLTACLDPEIILLVQKEQYLGCLETQRLMNSTLPKVQVLNLCKDEKNQELLGSKGLKYCKNTLEELGANTASAFEYCLHPSNQDLNNLQSLKECMMKITPLANREYSLRFCIQPVISKDLTPSVMECLIKSTSFLAKSYFDDDGRSTNLLPMLTEMAGECKNPTVTIPDRPSARVLFHSAKFLAHNTDFQYNRIGGLSGLSYDEGANLLYVVSDDTGNWGPNRFFEFKIDLKNGFSLEPSGDNILRTFTSGGFFGGFKQAQNIDAEGIVSLPDGRTVVSSETLLNGSKSFHKIYDIFNEQEEEIVLTDKFLPKIEFVEKEEKYTEYVQVEPIPDPKLPVGPVPVQPFPSWEPVVRTRIVLKRVQVQGIYINRGFESLGGTKDGKVLFTANEFPLVQDNFAERKIVRLIKLVEDGKTYKTESEFAYELDRSDDNGLVDVVVLNETTLLTLERRYDPTKNKVTAQIFKVELTNAQDYKDVVSLAEEESQRPVVTLKKKLLLNLDEILPHLPKGLRKIDNLEGITLGPVLPNGNRSLLLVSDNNFNANQFTQFIVLELLNL